MIEVTQAVHIEESELHYDFIRSSGPGGQNVNKVATAVQLRFDIRNSSSLPADVKQRLAELAGNQITKDGVLIIEARRHRTQEKNREDARQRLTLLILRALHKPRKRQPTRPGKAQRERRLQAKKNRSELKTGRRIKPEEW